MMVVVVVVVVMCWQPFCFRSAAPHTLFCFFCHFHTHTHTRAVQHNRYTFLLRTRYSVWQMFRSAYYFRNF
uniref:Putative secreted protein n=1 Tax=Anopheles marajoara TaxID=58244 RepID=A0A2M4CE12_9DIPT